MAQHTEQAFEDLIEEYLVKHGGWHRGQAAHFVPGMAVDPHELWSFLEATQKPMLKELEKSLPGDKLRTRLLADLGAAMQSVGTLEVLRRGFKVLGKTVVCAYFRPAHGMNPQLVEKYAQNRLTVTRQAYVCPDEEKKDRLDLLLLLNGLPVATVELKNPMTGSGVADAMKQYRETRDPGWPVYRFKSGAIVHFAVSTDLVSMTTKLAGKDTHFLPFNRGNAGGAGNPRNEHGHDTAYLWEEVWQRDAWLDLLHRFVHIAKEPGSADGSKPAREAVVFPRYHQLQAVRRLEAAAREEGPGHSYLVQHSAGSGKSNSIAWLAHRLANLHQGDERVFHTVVVVTDRKVLDRQLQDTIFQIDHKQGVVEKIDQHSEQLAAALQKGVPIVITTLQKFPVVAKKAMELPDRSYAVIIDEAHSSQGGTAATNLKRVLGSKEHTSADEQDVEVEEAPDQEDHLAEVMKARGKQKNLSFFAFTATPKAVTLEVFGRPGDDGKPVPFHLYSMRQAIEEGFILDVLRSYTSYQVLYKLAKATSEDPKVDREAATRQLGLFMSLHEYNIAEKAKVMLQHFRTKVQHRLGGKARAMVVTSSRRHAVRYFLEFKKQLASHGDDVDVLVAFSGTLADPKDPPNQEYTEAGLNGFPEGELPARFGQGKARILIVANKYQTGFDQPLLQTMYVDRPLGGVQAVQTLSRLNRTYPGKAETFVLDFYNKGEDIQRAFQPYYEQTSVAETADPQQLYKLQHELDAAQIYHLPEVEGFSVLFYAPPSKQARHDHDKLQGFLKPAVARFAERDEREQDEFRSKLGAFVSLYAFLSQILTFQDADLEKRYSFGRFLRELLPGKARPGVVQLEEAVQLHSYRLDRLGERNLTLKVAEPTPLPPVTFGEGSKTEPEQSTLREIIKTLNERFGIGLTEADQLFFEQIVRDTARDADVAESAHVNEIDSFSLSLKKKLNKQMMDRMDRNSALVTKYINEPDFQKSVFERIAQAIYDLARAAPRPPSVVPPPVAPDDLPLSALAEVSKLRNTLEPKLRRFLKRQLKSHLGSGWIKPILDVLPEQQRNQLVGVDADKILNERLLLSNLMTVLQVGWDKYFKVLEAGSPTESVKKPSVQVLLEFVNAHREDAHAKPISKTDAAAVQLAVKALEDAIDRHLAD